MHGYQMIQELSRRSGGRWNPTAASVYPTLQMLEDEGLVTTRQSPEGKRLFELTDAGREEAARVAVASPRLPWEPAHAEPAEPTRDLFVAIGDTARVLLGAAAMADDGQRARIVELLNELRDDLGAIVPQAATSEPLKGWGRGPRLRFGVPGFSFDIPEWIFGPGRGASPSGSWPAGARSPGGSSGFPDREEWDDPEAGGWDEDEEDDEV